MNTKDEKIAFGNKNQPFFELSPLYYSTFELFNHRWYSLMHFWVINSISDIYVQKELMQIKSIEKMIISAKKSGFVDIDIIDKTSFLMSIHEAFTQDERRGMILISTGSAELLYNAPKSYLTENNRYGKLLMRMRHIIADETK